MTVRKPASALRGNTSMTVPPILVKQQTGEFVVPEPPATLGKVGRATWRSVWRAGQSAYLPAIDSFSVERYSLLAERAHRLRTELDTGGLTVTNSRLQVSVSPVLRALQSVESAMQTLEDRLGLNPEARLKLNLTSQELSTKKSALDEFDSQSF